MTKGLLNVYYYCSVNAPLVVVELYMQFVMLLDI